MKDTFRKALGFLGLIEDDYGDYASSVPARPFTDQPDYADEPDWGRAPSSANRPYPTAPAGPVAPRSQPATRRPSSISVLDSAGGPPRVRPMPSPRPRPPATLANEYEPAILFPQSYNESRRITDLLRSSRVVVLNVSDVEPADARRLVDFASGTAYALSAKIERLDLGIYLICPQGSHFSVEARASLRASRYRSLDAL